MLMLSVTIQKKMKYSNTTTKKRNFLAPLLLVILLFAGVFAYWYFQQDNSTVNQDDSGINYNPPTEEEQRAGDDIKEQLPDRSNTNDDEEENNDDGQPSDTIDKKNASVIITDANQYGSEIEVRAFAQGVIELNGTCYFQFRNDSSTLSRETPARADASSTICGNLIVDKSEFPTTGEWQVTVRYESNITAGSSEARAFTIN
ncbi:hypothetical protein BH23PAT2_BH23PAT2_03800 [soil metagenome]